jgi:GH43 family beta-xylosidase
MNSIWAPEIHQIEGKWYIYFTADDGNINHHRMHVIESDTDDALGGYKFMGILDTESWAMYFQILFYQLISLTLFL